LADARLAYARVHHAAGNPGRALTLLAEALASLPDSPGEPLSPDESRVKAAAYFLAAELTYNLALSDPPPLAAEQFLRAEGWYTTALELWAVVGDETEQARVLESRGNCYTQHARLLTGDPQTLLIVRAVDDHANARKVRRGLANPLPPD
jgi:tetratricopeptide (TPR) repeat protein